MEVMPAQPTQETLDSVRMELRRKPAIAATATNTAVQVPCDDMAFRAVDTPTIAEAVQKIMTVMSANSSIGLTDTEDDVENLLADAAAKDKASIRKTVYLWVVDFELAQERRTVSQHELDT